MAGQGFGELAQAIGPRALRWGTVVVVIAVCVSLGLQLHLFMRSLAVDHADARPSTVEVTRRAPPPRITGREIAAWDLFGAAAADPEAAAEDMDNLPTTNLRFVLRGTFAAEKDQNSSAIVEGPDDRVEFYAVGDSMPSGVTLHAVYRDRIVLSRGGRLETLYFPDATGGMDMGGGSGSGNTAARVEQRKREIMKQQLEQIREKLKLRQQQNEAAQ